MKHPPELQAVFDAIEQGGPFASIEDANRILAVHMREYNTSPPAELGGLSPDETTQLLHGDWMTRGALRLADTLTLEELAKAAMLAETA